MSIEPTSDALERASAYLDGALAADERQEIEGSAQMMSWVASLAAVRADLAVVQPATSAQRDDAIAAAMAELEPAGLPATHTAHDAIVRTMPRRSRLVAVMGSAAAAVVLIVVGITVARSGSSDPDVATPAAVASDTATPSAEVAADVGGGTASGDVASPATLGPITGPATVLPEIDTSEQLQAYAAASPKVSTYATEATTGPDTSDVPAVTASDAIAPLSRIVVPPPACLPVDAVVLGTVAVAGTTATVIQTADGELQALDNACSVLLTAAP